MNDTTITNLFPTPVYISNIKKNFNTEELSVFKQSKLDTFKNTGNIGSKNTYILNEKKLSNIKKQINERVKDYFNKVLRAVGVEPYITQSWLNYTEKNQFHHSHNHPNSLVSGVFYIDADKDNDRIKFFKAAPQFRINAIDFNEWNSESWWVPVETGQMLLFPSSLNHMVENKKGNNTRVSLAFNVFVKGNLGSKHDYTELKL